MEIPSEMLSLSCSLESYLFAAGSSCNSKSSSTSIACPALPRSQSASRAAREPRRTQPGMT
jgi:hypothetical protein